MASMCCGVPEEKKSCPPSEKKQRVTREGGHRFIFNCSDGLMSPNESTHEKCVLFHINITTRGLMHPPTPPRSLNCRHNNVMFVRRSSAEDTRVI